MNQLELIQEAIEKAKAVLEDSQFARLHDSEGEEVKVKRPPKNPKEEKIDMPKDANKEMIKEDNPFLDEEEEKDTASRKKRLQERLDNVEEEMESYDSMKDGKSNQGYRRLLSERDRLKSSIEDIDSEIYKSVVLKGLLALQEMTIKDSSSILKSDKKSDVIKQTYETLETMANDLPYDNTFADQYENLSKSILTFLKENRI
tara:strand:- start:379 stop:984 length:606 start_codon:yes stop_codon:yes gene_type:complete